MKNKLDPRHIRRVKNFQSLFAREYGNQGPESENSQEIISRLQEIDAIIQKNAPKWPLDKINKVDLAVLRCAFWELLYLPSTPAKVVIDEAIEIAKEFGNQSSASFVNGVIGSAAKQNLFNLNHESSNTPTEPAN